MKNLAILIIFCAFVFNASAQRPFKVISVNGEILAKKANLTLQSGLEIKSDDNFSFIKPNSRAALINPDLGRVILTEQNSSSAFSKAAFAPAMSSVSTRGTSSNVLYNKLNVSTYFSEKLLVIDKLEIKISDKVFPMNNNAYFFIRYMYNGDEINKKLSFKNDTLIIDKKELYAIDGKPIPNPEIDEMKLYYYEITGDNSKATFLSSFNLVFIPNDQLKSEVQLILDACAKQTYEKKFSEVYDFLTSFYGAIDQTYVESWLDIEFGLKKK